MTDSLEQILELIKKTGDRCVVIDRATEQNYVVMSVKDYERLVFRNQEITELSEAELTDKINREIALWKSSAARKHTDALPIDWSHEFGTTRSELSDEADSALPASASGASPLNLFRGEDDWWKHPSEKPQPLDDKSGDEQYYLEPVES